MIRVAQVRPELTYTFQHILLHEAAYHSIVDEDRKALHLSVGSALEALYPDQQQRLASQLAEHFLEGGRAESALHYFDTPVMSRWIRLQTLRRNISSLPPFR